jgi:integrase
MDKRLTKISLYTRDHGTRKLVPAPKPRAYPIGTIFVLRSAYFPGKWKTVKGSHDYFSAMAELHKVQQEILSGKQAALVVRVEQTVKKENGILMLDRAIETYRNNLQIKALQTESVYGLALTQFYASTKNKPMTELVKQDLINFEIYMRTEGSKRIVLSDRTISNRMRTIVTFLREYGIFTIKHKVKFTRKKVRAYSADVMHALFEAATAYEWLLFQFFLVTGFRLGEMEHAEKSDINFKDGVIAVSEKKCTRHKHRPAGIWKPKDSEEREVKLPRYLLDILKECPNGVLFPGGVGKGKPILILKRLAKLAGLEGNFKIHLLRKSFATLMNENGVPRAFIQERLGHTNPQTTDMYCEQADIRSAASEALVESTFGRFAVGNQKEGIQ